ncbi:5-methylcytosine restriction system specificity protein McrC [Alkalihalobacterium elongatum]|uniref:5-methylcytosine restriction system specificity protein McrC n=1 Tax=Alkalihalobacterium elongatum TaxID=2675466 RepID=UPI001C1F416A|nr:hypothetical protein [Alkalihalobacterium elongatum]
METTFKVPIRNLFCLLSYVNEMPDLVESFNEVDEDIITYDFLAKQFLQEVDKLNRRGLVKNYIARTEPTSRLGGRIIMNDSLPYILAKKPMVVCEKDEYSANILFNHMMKSTLKRMCVNRYIKDETRKRSFMYMELLPEVETIVLTREIFLKVYFGRHNVHYKRMIHIARLLHEMALLSHKQGNWSLFSAEVDETSLNHIFEKFLFNFYRIEQTEYHVSSEVMHWQLEGNSSILPSMRTDISLVRKDRKEKIIIDAKFYKNIFQQNFGKASFHSHNMYQMFTYLMHQPKDIARRGILIYPYNGEEVREKYRWDDQTSFEVVTLNLDHSWVDIYRQLMEVVNGGGLV